MKQFLFCSSLSWLLLSSCNNKDAAKSFGVFENAGALFSDSVESSIHTFQSHDVLAFHKVNSYYEVFDIRDGANSLPVIFKVQQQEVSTIDSVAAYKTCKITAANLQQQPSKKVAWTKEFQAADFELNNRNLILTEIASGYDEDYIRHYSLETGEEVIGFCYGALEVMVPNSLERRYIGYTSQECATHPLQNLNDGSLLGIITYASTKKSLQQLKLKLKRSEVASKIPHRTPDLYLTHTDGVNASVYDGKGLILLNASKGFSSDLVNDFSVQITFYFGDAGESTQILIPVVNDQLDVSAAKYDAAVFTIE